MHIIYYNIVEVFYCENNNMQLVVVRIFANRAAQHGVARNDCFEKIKISVAIIKEFKTVISSNSGGNTFIKFKVIFFGIDLQASFDLPMALRDPNITLEE